jgi:hypothetical protein
LEQGAAALGVFSVGKSSAVSILTLLQVKKPEVRIAMMRNAAGKKRDSSRKTTVLVTIIHTAQRDGSTL